MNKEHYTSFKSHIDKCKSIIKEQYMHIEPNELMFALSKLEEASMWFDKYTQNYNKVVNGDKN